MNLFGDNIKCIICEHPLREPGAILLSPPSKRYDDDVVLKFHICVSCYGSVWDELQDLKKELGEIIK